MMLAGLGNWEGGGGWGGEGQENASLTWVSQVAILLYYHWVDT